MTTYTYVGSGSSIDWNDPAAWSPAGVPGASDSAIIAAGAASVVTADQNISVDDLALESGATVDVGDAGRLTILGAINNGGQIKVGSLSEIVFAASLATAGLGTITAAQGATVDFAGTLDNIGATLLAGPYYLSGAIEGGVIAGSVYVGNSEELTLSDGARFAGAGGAGSGDVHLGLGTLAFAGSRTLSNLTIEVADDWFSSETGYDAEPVISTSAGSVESFAANSAITLDPNAEFRFSDGGSIIEYGKIIASEGGGFAIAGPLGTTAPANPPTYTNAGLIDLANSASLGISAQTSFTNTGAIEVDGTSEVLFDDALITAQLGTIIAAPGAWICFDGTLDNTGAIYRAPTGVAIGGTIKGGTIEGPIESRGSFSQTVPLSQARTAPAPA